MHPYLFELPLPWGATLRPASYGLMIAVGFLVSLWLLQRRGRRMGLDPEALFDMATVALLGGIVGARLFYVVHHWSEFSESPLSVLAFWRGGLAFYGGVMGGSAGLFGVVWWRRLPLRRTLDVAASLLPLGHAFGRVGCFLNGCCFGEVTDLWLGLRFPRVVNRAGEIIGSPVYQAHRFVGWTFEQAEQIRATFSAAFVKEFQEATVLAADRYVLDPARDWSLPIHPTQLYEVGYELAIFALLSFVLVRRRRRPGEVAWLYGIGYGTARFLNEFLRADTRPLEALGGLTIFQAASIAMVALGVGLLLEGLRRPPEPLPEPWQPPAADTTPDSP
jgi:phosphatidylglycerol:prolipoprotein diacylglycerol transferase